VRPYSNFEGIGDKGGGIEEGSAAGEEDNA